MSGYSFNFTTFGDATTASSRLRAFKLADELNRRGHRATVNAEQVAQIEVFQKVRHFARLRAVSEGRATVVYDFDDNYLLDDVGTRDDLARFMLAADLVTAGSRAIMEAAERFSDQVYLFENPLDVADEQEHRQPRGSLERIGWFGNRTNLLALEALELAHPVVTITAGGDIVWRLETIDSDVMNLDLVLVPVLASAWTLSKNANRVLKCVALGVPFLASQTPEHVEVAQRLHLERFLVAQDEDWNRRIELLQKHYRDAEAEVLGARPEAISQFGIATTVDRWLEAVIASRGFTRERLPALATAGPGRRGGRRPLGIRTEMLRDVRVVCVNENEPDFVQPTLDSLRLDEVEFRDVTLVSARVAELAPDERQPLTVVDGHSDFFSVPSSWTAAFDGAVGAPVLLLRAGVRLGRGFFLELRQHLSEDAFLVFRPQIGRPHFKPTLPPPDTIDDLLLRPYLPEILLIPGAAIAHHGTPDPRFLALSPWEFMIRSVAGGDFALRRVELTVAEVDHRTHARTPMESFGLFLSVTDPATAADLPNLRNEWNRLLFTLQSHVIDRHRAVFAERAGVLLPRMEAECRAAEQEAAGWNRKFVEARSRAVAPPTEVKRGRGDGDALAALRSQVLAALGYHSIAPASARFEALRREALEFAAQVETDAMT